MSSEFTDTVLLANVILDKPWADPDRDAAMLARQFLRAVEVIQWIASQQDLFFAECSQAEEIVSRCKQFCEKP